jgi:hypothetical protein
MKRGRISFSCIATMYVYNIFFILRNLYAVFIKRGRKLIVGHYSSNTTTYRYAQRYKKYNVVRALGLLVCCSHIFSFYCRTRLFQEGQTVILGRTRHFVGIKIPVPAQQMRALTKLYCPACARERTSEKDLKNIGHRNPMCGHRNHMKGLYVPEAVRTYEDKAYGQLYSEEILLKLPASTGSLMTEPHMKSSYT